jgi:cell division protein FtsN
MDPVNNGQVSNSVPQKKSKTVLIIVAVVIVAIIAVIWWQMGGKKESPVSKMGPTEVPTDVSPEVPAGTLEDTTPVINQELQSIDTGDLEKEFQQIDKDLNNL